MRLLHAAVAGVGFVALLACIEKYTRFNPVTHIMTADVADMQEGGMRLRDIVATYQHRILLGTGMAMGAPLAFVLAGQAANRRQRRYFWILSILMVAACYFSQSRGPWLGAVMACGVLAYLGSARARKVLVRIAVLTLLVLIARPGVYTTLFNSAKVTTESKTFKGGTFQYRLELWRVAWDEVTKSPERFLFGYGPGCGLESTVQWNLSYRGKEMEIWSWDNQYAYDLYQSGFAGLLTRLALYFAMARGIFKLYRRSEPADRDILAGLFASAFVLIFMMSNVLIYVKQLHFLFGTIAAVGFSFALPKLPETETDAAGERLPEAAQPALTV
jgi:O-antigen ligase